MLRGSRPVRAPSWGLEGNRGPRDPGTVAGRYRLSAECWYKSQPHHGGLIMSGAGISTTCCYTSTLRVSTLDVFVFPTPFLCFPFQLGI
ncbi:unnamed protein product [Arctogadus glacialis]